MSEFKMEIGMMGTNSRQSSRPTQQVRTLRQFASLLDAAGLHGELKNAVLKRAAGYPEGALDKLYSNIDRVIRECQAELVKAIRQTIPEPEPKNVPAGPIVTKPVAVQVKKKSLFEELLDDPAMKPIVKPEPETETQAPTPKWTKASALEVSKMRQNVPPPISVSMSNGQVPAKGLSDMTPEEATAHFQRMLKLNPPREGKSRREEQDDF